MDAVVALRSVRAIALSSASVGPLNAADGTDVVRPSKRRLIAAALSNSHWGIAVSEETSSQNWIISR